MNESAAARASALPRLGILRDFPEELWPSMDLCGEMLAEHLQRDAAQRWTVVEMRPPFRRRLQHIPLLGRKRFAVNADKLLNRLWDYPRHAQRHRADADVFHIVDHSYAQILEGLPAEQTGIFCHDLDAFRCLLRPDLEPRPRWFRTMTRRILTAFQKAALVFTSNRVITDQILTYQLVERARLIEAPLGFADEFRPDPPEDPAANSLLASMKGRPYLMHVGVCSPRKRIEVLLEVVSRLREKMPELQLLKVGGEWTAEQRELIDRRRLIDHLVHVSGITRNTLACLYRRATLVLVPSDAEGFGLPVLEALACGTAVLASDLEVVREMAGDTVRFAPAGDIDAFVKLGWDWIQHPDAADAINLRVARARRYSWRRHAEIIGDAYRRLLLSRR